MKLFHCRLENSSNVKIWLLSYNIASSLSQIANTDEMKEEDILNGKFRVKPSLFRVFGKKGKAVASGDQRRKFFMIEIACPGINNYDNGFSFFPPKFKISSSFRIEAWTTDFGILRLLVEQVIDDGQFGILVKTGAICFAFSFDIRLEIIGDVQTIYVNSGDFKTLDVQIVLGLPNIPKN